MFDLKDLPKNDLVEQIVSVLNTQTQNPDKGFFRINVVYFLAKMASNMRTTIATKDRGSIPINAYAINLATSGYGKGYSMFLLEHHLFHKFQEKFIEETIPELSEIALRQLAAKKAVWHPATPEEEWYEALKKDVERHGEPVYTFDGGTVPAVKQLHSCLVLRDVGAISLQVDELAQNLTNSTEILTAFLELYDTGRIKHKITKNSPDNVRTNTVNTSASVPTNMMLFGTPVKLLEGNLEATFLELLDTGYARRSLFGFGKTTELPNKTAEEIYAELAGGKTKLSEFDVLADTFAELANPTYYKTSLELSEENSILLIKYRLHCEKQAAALPENATIRKAELTHRNFKALKVAGALAFAEGNFEVTTDHIMQAIGIVEESGLAFDAILRRDKNYVRLAKHILSTPDPVTNIDLMEELPFYRSASTRKELMPLAVAWAYKHNAIIKQTLVNGIEVYTGESLKLTNTAEMIVSYSTDLAVDYQAVKTDFTKLVKLTDTPDIHWSNHHFLNNHRLEANAIEGFNLLVLDIDGTAKLSFVKEVLQDYQYIIYTTKRHTEEVNRFRVLMPISHVLKMSSDTYKEFYKNILEYLPFTVDTQANQRSRKWLTNPKAKVYCNFEGKLFDALPFIPNAMNAQGDKTIGNASKLEAWLLSKESELGRNNVLLRYALALHSNGVSQVEAVSSVLSLNNQFKYPLPENEITTTVLVTLSKKYC